MSHSMRALSMLLAIFAVATLLVACSSINAPVAHMSPSPPPPTRDAPPTPTPTERSHATPTATAVQLPAVPTMIIEVPSIIADVPYAVPSTAGTATPIPELALITPLPSASAGNVLPSASASNSLFGAPGGDPGVAAATRAFPTSAIDAVLDRAGGTWGVAISDVTNQHFLYARNIDTAIPAASLAKLPICLAMYQAVSAGQVTLDDTVTLQADDVVDGSGTLQYAEVGSVYTLRELCRRALHDSDNVAANMVLRTVGLQAVQATIQSLGLDVTRVERSFRDKAAIKAGHDNVTSAKDMYRLLATTLTSSTLDAAAQRDVTTALTHAERDTPITQGVPAGTLVWEKIGSLPSDEHATVEHAVGIVVKPGTAKAWVIVLMSRDVENSTARATMKDIAGIANSWFVNAP